MKRVSLVVTLALAAGLSAQAASAQTLKTVKDRGMDAGQVIESNTPQEFFANPQHARTKLFLSQILRH